VTRCCREDGIGEAKCHGGGDRAGDFIGSAIAKKFAAEGFTIFAGRRNADKLAPLVADIEVAGGEIVACGLDARKEDDITDF